MDLTSETNNARQVSERRDREPFRLFAVALITLSSLALEVELTRLFSVLYFPPAVFGILSLAILGIGLGAALVTWRAPWRDAAHIPLYLALAAGSGSAIVLAAAVPALQPALIGMVVLPYLFIGMALTTIFSARPEDSSRLYMADLVGAGLGALAAVPMLNWLGAVNAILVTALLLALAALLFYPRVRLITFAPFAVVLVLLAGNLAFSWLAIDMRHLPVEKPIVGSLDNINDGREAAGELLDSRWDAFARSDLVRPADGSPYRLYIDGAAGSIMPPAADNEFLWDDIGFFPFATEQPQRVFLIGPGAGLDVWFALESNAEEIVAVEVNPSSIELVRKYSDYNGDLYGQPSVRVLNDDGRSVLQRDQTQYDLIFLSQLVTLAAERNGYALVENSSYTVEAFATYMAHLSDEGQIGIKLYDEPTLTRALSTVLATFRQQGLSDQEGLSHIIALLDGRAEPPIPLLIISKRAYTRDDSLALGSIAQQVGFTPLFLPGVIAQPPLDRVVEGTQSFSDITASAENDLAPTVDDRPFFYQFERGIPQALQPLLWGALLTLLIGMILVALHQREASAGRWRLAAPLYFAGLGLGFILVEIGVIQQTRLFLGHPTTAITAVLAILLISGGVGSAFAGRWFADRPSLSAAPIVSIIALLVLWLIGWPYLQGRFAAAALIVRILIVAVCILPLGFVMGMPFPLGLRNVSRQGRRQVPLAWTINGVMSVIGSVLAVTVAILLGYRAVMVGGMLAYALTASAVIMVNNLFGGLHVLE
ncbi:MAG: hypothetical protein ACK2UK_10480 [Candidatus Promineifilaceae bacterium]